MRIWIRFKKGFAASGQLFRKTTEGGCGRTRSYVYENRRQLSRAEPQGNMVVVLR